MSALRTYSLSLSLSTLINSFSVALRRSFGLRLNGMISRAWLEFSPESTYWVLLYERLEIFVARAYYSGIAATWMGLSGS